MHDDINKIRAFSSNDQSYDHLLKHERNKEENKESLFKDIEGSSKNLNDFKGKFCSDI
jgi:hypothetical protein